MESLKPFGKYAEHPVRDIKYAIVETFAPGNELHRQALYPSADMDNIIVDVTNNTINYLYENPN